MKRSDEIPYYKTKSPFGSVGELKRDPLGFLDKLAKYKSPLVQFKLGPKNCYLVQCPKLTHEILAKQTKHFRKSSVNKSLKYILGNGLVTVEGGQWKKQRKLVQKAFHTDSLPVLTQKLGEVVQLLLQKVDWTQPGIDFHRSMQELTMEVILRSILISDSSEDLSELAKAIDVLMKKSNETLFSIFKIPRWIPTPENIEHNQAVKQIKSFIDTKIKQRINGEGSDAQDLLALLLNVFREEQGSLDTDRMRDELLTMFVAGHETTTNALSWVFYYVGGDEKVQEKLQEEIDQYSGDDGLSYETLQRMVYTRSIVMEVLRLRPPAWIFTRQTYEDMELGDYSVSANSLFLLSPWVMHRNPDFWNEPEAFNPDRFLNLDVEPDHFIPFGKGPRICVGKAFALNEMIQVMFHFFKTYSVARKSEERIPPMAVLTLRPKGPVYLQVSER